MILETKNISFKVQNCQIKANPVNFLHIFDNK